VFIRREKERRGQVVVKIRYASSVYILLCITDKPPALRQTYRNLMTTSFEKALGEIMAVLMTQIFNFTMASYRSNGRSLG